jgi:hypothetical protein
VPITLKPPEVPARGQGVTEAVRPGDLAAAGRKQPSGTIAIESPDPLAIAEIRDETGNVVALKRPGKSLRANPGFYRVRGIGPETGASEQFVALTADEDEVVKLEPAAPGPFVAKLVSALGGSVDADGFVVPPGGAQRLSWTQPSTVVATAVAAALRGSTPPGLGVTDVRAALGEAAKAGVAVFAVAGDGKPELVEALRVRMWPTGGRRGDEERVLAPSEHGVGGVAVPVMELPKSGPLTYWVSLRAEDTAPLVPVPILPGRMATLVAQLEPDRLRLYQFHPRIESRGGADDDVRRVEYLERMLAAGSIDVAEPLAIEIAGAAAEDPFAALVAGYVLLRRGRDEGLELLEELASTILSVAPGLSDAYILRAERAAQKDRKEASAQAFADAANAGVPVFGEGLTRLVEGLRSSGLLHPRGAVVRHMFQNHVRGSMWASFAPTRPIVAGETAISAGDLGFEA